MKRVPCLPAEPPELAAYRAANPLDAVATGGDAGRAWGRFRDDIAYGVVRDRLVAAQEGLCGYCEQRLTHKNGTLDYNNQQIEHVLAKSGGPGRTLDFANFMLCCGGGSYRENDPQYRDAVAHYHGDMNVACGQRKADADLGVCCDPRTFPWAPRLVDVGLDGTVKADDAACQTAGVNPTDLNKTINDVLNLNCERLRVARQRRVRAITEEFLWLVNELFSRTALSGAAKQSVGESLAEGRLAPDAHGHLCAFWTVERQYLEPWSETWLAKNAHRLGYP